jgi:hypothetical protein
MRLCLILLVLLLAQAARAQDEAPPSGLSVPPLVDASAEPVPPPLDSPQAPPVVLGKGPSRPLCFLPPPQRGPYSSYADRSGLRRSRPPPGHWGPCPSPDTRSP